MTDAQLKARLERQLRAQLAAVTGGLAPDDYLNAWWEWYLGLATHPKRQLALAQSAMEKMLDSWQFMAQAATGTSLAPQHKELGFDGAAWNVWPFNAYAHAYGNWVSWWQEALNPDSRMSFAGRLLLEAASPANFLHTNPELLNRTVAESGHNLIRGLKNWLEDAQRALGGAPPVGTEQFKVGKDVDDDIRRVKAIQRAIDGRATMRIDANRAFAEAHARALSS